MLPSKELVWHSCRDSRELQSGPHGILEPNPSCCPSLPRLPEGLIVLVPGVGFTPDGKRLGQGAGCYDRILGRRDLVSIGVAFTCQIVEDLPTEIHDQSLHFLVSPDGLRTTQIL
jgi:5-formyltetrahydrofolate cyclo-ligase